MDRFEKDHIAESSSSLVLELKELRDVIPHASQVGASETTISIATLAVLLSTYDNTPSSSDARISASKGKVQKEIEALRTMDPVTSRHVRSEIVGRLSVLLELGLIERAEVDQLEALADAAQDEGETAAEFAN